MRADLSLAQRPRRFDPRALFAAGGGGAWYEARPDAAFQDSAGTVPAAWGQPVGRLVDLSGNGNHAVQTQAAARPVLARDPGGYGYLLFDGVDDCLKALFACPAFDRVSAMRLVTAATGNHIVGGGANNFGVLVQHGAAPGIAMFSGDYVTAAGPVAGQDGVVAERHRGTGSELRIDGGTAAAGNAGTGSAGGLTIGAYLGGTYNSHIRLYALVMTARRLADAEMAAARRWAGARAGLSL